MKETKKKKERNLVLWGLIIGAIIGFLGGLIPIVLSLLTFPIWLPFLAFTSDVLSIQLEGPCYSIFCDYPILFAILTAIYYGFCGFCVGWIGKKFGQKETQSLLFWISSFLIIYLVLAIFEILNLLSHGYLLEQVALLYIPAPLILIVLGLLVGVIVRWVNKDKNDK